MNIGNYKFYLTCEGFVNLGGIIEKDVEDFNSYVKENNLSITLHNEDGLIFFKCETLDDVFSFEDISELYKERFNEIEDLKIEGMVKVSFLSSSESYFVFVSGVWN